MRLLTREATLSRRSPLAPHHASCSRQGGASGRGEAPAVPGPLGPPPDREARLRRERPASVGASTSQRSRSTLLEQGSGIALLLCLLATAVGELETQNEGVYIAAVLMAIKGFLLERGRHDAAFSVITAPSYRGTSLIRKRRLRGT